jgi:hypothetical protein
MEILENGGFVWSKKYARAGVKKGDFGALEGFLALALRFWWV